LSDLNPLVSVVVTTRNEEQNIVNCLRSIAAQTWKNIEIVVVDNASSDKTKELASQFTEKVFDKGPERSAQRNFGITEISRGDYAMFIDADMLLTPSVVEKCVEAITRVGVSGLHIEEIVLGRGYLAQIRRFERSFYSGTVVDGIRFFSRELFNSLGGFDQELPPGPEDWDLDKRFKMKGSLALIPRHGGHQNNDLDAFVQERGVTPETGFVGIYHNEDEQTLKRYIEKKSYYSGSMDSYVAKWGSSDPDVKKQLGLTYRYATVFVENSKWKQLIRHPLLTSGMLQLRILVGLNYLRVRRKNRITQR
jgi:glycosyltransferase involved in cell wall biosynthesis